MAKKKETHAGTEHLGKNDVLPVTEVGEPGPVEKVAETAFVDGEVEREAFMNEILVVIVHQNSDKEAVDMPCPNVNGLNQPFIRGQKQRVKRKYVESLARCRIIGYEQETPDPTRPENIQMKEKPAIAYPFSVLEDPNPKGREWLESILAQPA